MAEFTKEAAKIEQVFVRRLLANGDSEYIRRPFNLVTYDNGVTYVEPVNSDLLPMARGQYESAATAVTFRIVDVEPFSELTEFR